MDLLALLRQHEGKTLEFKRDLPKSDGLLRTLVAFANSAGGVILLGVEDKTRDVCGVPDPVLLEEQVANQINSGVRPQLLPSVEILPWRKTHVVAIIVHLSSNRPHCVSKLGMPTGVFVRVGSSNRRVDSAMLAEIERSRHPGTYDEEPLPELNSEAVDFRVASESFAAVRKLKRSDLRTLRLTAKHQGREVPTVGGVLLFGVERLRLFPDAWIQVGCFGGVDRERILDTAAIKEHPLRAVEQALAFFLRHITRALEIRQTKHVEKWGVPPEALREAIINAVCHSDYTQQGSPIRVAIFSDRIVIDSPGMLPAGLTVDEIRRGVSKLRNRVLGRIFHELGLIEQWGSGIQRMIAACRDAGLDEPTFEEIGFQFRVTFFTTRRQETLISKADQPILEALHQEDGLSTQQLATRIGRSQRGTRMRLAGLVARGLLVEVGSGPQDPRRRYFLVARSGGLD